MPVYKDNAQNRKLGRVGEEYVSGGAVSKAYGNKGNTVSKSQTGKGGGAPIGNQNAKGGGGAKQVKKAAGGTKQVKKAGGSKTTVPDVKQIQDAWRKHLDKDTGPLVNVVSGKENYYLKIPKNFILKNIIPELNKGKSLENMFREVNSLVRKGLKWGTDFQNMPGE
tara:strand:+ start:100 stop:597 length:498 start_codon:yes stop_codon:yes gene_type:complete